MSNHIDWMDDPTYNVYILDFKILLYKSNVN